MSDVAKVYVFDFYIFFTSKASMHELEIPAHLWTRVHAIVTASCAVSNRLVRYPHCEPELFLKLVFQ